MLASKEKISLRQLAIILFTITYTPALRALPAYTANAAHQAAWLSPLVTLGFFIPIIFLFSSIYKKYREESLMEIMEDILGKLGGKIITILYIILITLLLILNTRNYADKLVATIYPDVNIIVFYVFMLALVAFILRRGGIVILARMNEIIFPILATIFLSLFLLSLRDIRISRLTPISPLDILPVFQANIGVMVIFSYFPFLFLLSNYVNNKEKLKKVCFQTLVILAFLLMALLISTIGVLGQSTIELTQVPYIAAIKQISLFHTLERIESAVISQWIFSDFVIISVLLLSVLNMFKSLFKLSDTKPFIGIYLMITLLAALMLARNAAELELFISTVIFPPTIFLGYVMPVLVYVVGKIRRKL